MSLATAILVSDTEGVKFAKLQRGMRAIADALGFTYSMNGLLSDILPSDTEGVKWAKLGRWTGFIGESISAGGGPGAGANGTASATNNAGTTTLTRQAPNTLFILTVTGAARTSPIVLATTGAVSGDRATVLASMPAIGAGTIDLSFRNAIAGGTQLLPDPPYQSQVLSSQASAFTARLDFAFVGGAWIYVGSAIPA